MLGKFLYAMCLDTGARSERAKRARSLYVLSAVTLHLYPLVRFISIHWSTPSPPFDPYIFSWLELGTYNWAHRASVKRILLAFEVVLYTSCYVVLATV